MNNHFHHSFENLNNYQKYTFILQNVHVIIGFIGLIGNTLTFSIFLRKPLTKHSYAFYYRIMSWTDNVILAHAFRHWARIVLNMNIDLLGPFFCRFNEYQPYVAGSISTWLRILILFDMLIRVNYPTHFRLIRRKWFQIIAVSLIFIYSALLHSIIPLNNRLEMTGNTLICHLPPDILGLNLTLVLFNFTLSVVISSMLKFKLISHIYMSRKRIRNKLFKKSSSVVKDRKFAISSIGVSFTFFFCIFTFTIVTLSAVVLQLSPHQIEAVFTSCVTLTICSNSSLFFVNMFMNSIFHKEFRSLFSSS